MARTTKHIVHFAPDQTDLEWTDITVVSAKDTNGDEAALTGTMLTYLGSSADESTYEMEIPEQVTSGFNCTKIPYHVILRVTGTDVYWRGFIPSERFMQGVVMNTLFMVRRPNMNPGRFISLLAANDISFSGTLVAGTRIEVWCARVHYYAGDSASEGEVPSTTEWGNYGIAHDLIHLYDYDSVNGWVRDNETGDPSSGQGGWDIASDQVGGYLWFYVYNDTAEDMEDQEVTLTVTSNSISPQTYTLTIPGIIAGGGASVQFDEWGQPAFQEDDCGPIRTVTGVGGGGDSQITEEDWKQVRGRIGIDGVKSTPTDPASVPTLALEASVQERATPAQVAQLLADASTTAQAIREEIDAHSTQLSAMHGHLDNLIARLEAMAPGNVFTSAALVNTPSVQVVGGVGTGQVMFDWYEYEQGHADDPAYAVSGVIVAVYNNENATGNPEASAVTDELGRAKLWLDTGVYYVFRRKAGRQFTNPIRVTVSHTVGDSVEEDALALDYLNFTWYEYEDGHEGEPGYGIPDVDVLVYDNELQSGDPVATVRTDEDGMCSFFVPQGTYYLFRSKAGRVFTNPAEVEVSP